MIRRPTQIMLALFAILLALAVFLQRTAILGERRQTPTATTYPKLIEGVSPAEIIRFEIEDSQAVLRFQLQKNADNQWVFNEDASKQVDQGKVQELISTLISLNVLNTIDPATALQVLGLDSPRAIITLTTSSGESKAVRIGNLAPPETGYYLQLNGNVPVIVNKFSVESLLDLLRPDHLAAVTPTPMLAGTATPIR